MGCRKPWNEAFLVDSFTKKWIKTWWDHRVQTILRYQKSFIPIAMRLVENHKAMDEAAIVMQKARYEMDKTRRYIKDTNRDIYYRQRYAKSSHLPPPSSEEIKLERLQLKAAKDSLPDITRRWIDSDFAYEESRRYSIDGMIRNRQRVHRHREFAFSEHLTNPTVGPPYQAMDPLEQPPMNGHGNLFRLGTTAATGAGAGEETATDPAASETNTVNVWPCPKTGCRALLNAEFRCIVCDTQVCDKCHAIPEGTEHECKREDVLSVRAIVNSSQACPRCRIRINRTSGCDQMWCTQCHTAFSYKTGVLINGQIHNPHYFQQLTAGEIKQNRHDDEPIGGRRQQQQPATWYVGGGCGGRQGLSNVDLIQIERVTPFPFSYIVRNWRHVADVTMGDLVRKRLFLDNSGHAPIPLACWFILDQINETQWAKIILSEQMSERFANETLQIYRTWVDAMRDEWEKMAADALSTPEAREWFQAMRRVPEYDRSPDMPTSVQLLFRVRYLAMQQISKVCNVALHNVNRIYGKKPEYVLMTRDMIGYNHSTQEAVLALQREIDPVKHLSPDQLEKRNETLKRKREAEYAKNNAHTVVAASACKKPKPNLTPEEEAAILAEFAMSSDSDESDRSGHNHQEATHSTSTASLSSIDVPPAHPLT